MSAKPVSRAVQRHCAEAFSRAADRAAAWCDIDLSLDPHAYRACYRYRSLRGQELREGLTQYWTGGDSQLAERLLSGAYLRCLPELLLRRLMLLLSAALPLLAFPAVFVLSLPWYLVLCGAVAVLVVSLLGVVVFVGPSAALEATVRASHQGSSGLFTEGRREKWRDRRWLDLPAQSLGTAEFVTRASGLGVGEEQLRAARVLLEDGWEDSARSLLETSRLLSV